jgi:hypothetical protein
LWPPRFDQREVQDVAKHLIKKLRLIDVAAEDHQAHRERNCQSGTISTRLTARIKAMFSSDNKKANDSKKGAAEAAQSD